MCNRTFVWLRVRLRVPDDLVRQQLIRAAHVAQKRLDQACCVPVRRKERCWELRGSAAVRLVRLVGVGGGALARETAVKKGRKMAPNELVAIGVFECCCGSCLGAWCVVLGAVLEAENQWKI